MSHELRTPIAAVIGLLDILICDECLNNDQYASITQIRKCSTALLHLLNDILDLSKVESGKLVLEETEFNLGRELEGLVDMFSFQCINHNVETILDISDDMPRLIQGDSARIVQIFANLISNSMKFTTTGHIILRGWCEYPYPSASQEAALPGLKCILNQPEQDDRCFKKEHDIVLWFQVDDSGSGIDPSKWKSVFESFEQADPSTTRLHGGTGLGLCIVQTLVQKMGGDIQVVKKNEQGTLMQLYLRLKTSVDLDKRENHGQFKFEDYKLTVVLALNGRMGRMIISQWLQKKGVCTHVASEWNGVMQILQENLPSRKCVHCLPSVFAESEASDMQGMSFRLFIIVIDIGILDLSTEIWKEQLTYLDEYLGSAKVAWILNYDTSTAVKTELRQRGHFLMINKPLYKAKIIQILQDAITGQNLELQKYMNTSKVTLNKDFRECQEIDSVPSSGASSNDLDISDQHDSCLTTSVQANGKRVERQAFLNQNTALGNYFVEFPPPSFVEDADKTENLCLMRSNQERFRNSLPTEQDTFYASKIVTGQKSLEGLRILLAEDTPVLQRVAKIMLEKLGAEVMAVGDGLQVLNALNIMFQQDEINMTSSSPSKDGNSKTINAEGMLAYHLILMDCQMPKMDGYEATKAIRKSESETGLHIPIVALTAHAMSSDKAKCLEVGMDAYLTKPIDCKLMVSTILSLTKRTA